MRPARAARSSHASLHRTTRLDSTRLSPSAQSTEVRRERREAGRTEGETREQRAQRLCGRARARARAMSLGAPHAAERETIQAEKRRGEENTNTSTCKCSASKSAIIDGHSGERRINERGGAARRGSAHKQ